MRTTRRSFTILYLCVTIMCAAAVHGQNEKTMVAQDKDESRLTYSAGSTITRNNPDGSWTKILSRGVNAHHQDTDLTAEEGLYNGSVSEIRFYGNAVFKDSVRKLNADTLIYLENSREAFAIGHVIVSESGRSLWADRVRYQKDIRRIEASGNVTVMDDSTRSFITGMEAVFNDSTGHGLIIGKPFLKKEDEGGSIMTATCSDTLELLQKEKMVRLWKDVVATKDSIILTCSDTLEIVDEDKSVRLWKKVVAIQDSLTARSERAVYHDLTETLTLTGNPEVQYVVNENREDAPSTLRTVSTITGDTTRVFLHDRNITGAEVIGSAVTTTTSTDTTGTLYDRSIIESTRMRLEMGNNFISLISAEGMARSYYHQNSTEKDKMFVNVAIGDTLTFFLNGGKIISMKIYGYGGGLGKGMYYDYTQDKTSMEPDSTKTEARVHFDH